uniref:AB hydrolase-1 domain-containing protein n=1 Tax=Panagrellus redivivus TaxID=6233 RepID=A0A7E4VDG9_PANRE
MSPKASDAQRSSFAGAGFTRTIVYVEHEPAGTSTKNIMHWIQMTRSGKFCKYDYENENEKRYGQSAPPDYDISTLTIPTYLYYSADDWLADPTDIETNLIPKLRNKTLMEANHLGVYNHLDYIWGMHAVDKIYKPIIAKIKKIESLKSNRPF